MSPSRSMAVCGINATRTAALRSHGYRQWFRQISSSSSSSSRRNHCIASRDTVERADDQPPHRKLLHTLSTYNTGRRQGVVPGKRSLASSSPSFVSSHFLVTQRLVRQRDVRLFSTATDDSTNNNNNNNISDSSNNPWRVAIVGSGPSGCYTAKYLMMGANSKLPSDRSALSIDVIERLPTAYGLVRNGVAPDHPEVKNVQHDFDALFEGQTTSSSDAHRLRFFGNVTVGDQRSSVSLEELRELYDMVVLAYGCESDRVLDLPVDVLGTDGKPETENEDEDTVSGVVDEVSFPEVEGILSAREFVNWYNGHPDYEWVTEEVREALWNKSGGKRSTATQNIVVVGHGNVAMDCARILAKSRESLNPTDLTTRSIDVLRPPASSEKEDAADPYRFVSVVGRRGHVQAAFTIKEVRELTKLGKDAELVLRPDELQMGASTEASKEESKARPRSRINKLLEGHAVNPEMETSSTTTEVHLRFLMNPVRFRANRSADSNDHEERFRLSSVVCERTRLEGDVPGKQMAEGTGSTETIPADLCLVSIGYKGLPIDETTRNSFDEARGVLKNDHGRVLLLEDDTGHDDDDDDDNTTNLAPLYVSGWLKRGPSGIIGTNIGDAKDTVVSILNDLGESSEKMAPKSLPKSLEDLLTERAIPFVDWDAYRRIEDCESGKDSNPLGHSKRHPDQPREKLVHREQLLQAAAAAAAAAEEK